MPRKPPVLTPVDPPPTAEQLCAGGAMRVRDAAAFTGLSRTDLYALMASGELRWTKPRKNKLVLKADLVALLARHMPAGA